ncbi:MAG: bis(5'-nucleosyl)-tetraphosphatase (symmetrical) YqeK [Elusimicrobia bacterium]|nr:bis(5'-nucleosyl)-tetraphosphatase (symmetrical) YqeK [Elusimicrobiota bacterium]
MKVLLFGGGFDPPHRGHRALLQAALKTLEPGRAILIPSWLSPTKERHGAPPAERLALARLLAKDLPGRACADGFELRRRRRTYTYEVLRHYRRAFPGAELWFLLGSDSLGALPSWRRPEELARSCGWVAGARPGAPAAAPAGFRTLQLPGRFPDVSSTELRARLYLGRGWRRLLDAPVAAFIERRGLYGLAARRDLERTLSPERYRHTLAVASLAAELARRHGLDPAAAALAGLLHDSGRRFDPAGMARYARARRLPVPSREETLRRAPLLAHAYIGADLARRRFGVSDPSVLAAIASHTLGRPKMTPLERLLYVADLSAEGRSFAAAARIRRLARRDLDAALREALAVKAAFARSRGGWLHPMTERVRRWAAGL